jgi:hypothetical protein
LHLYVFTNIYICKINSAPACSHAISLLLDITLYQLKHIDQGLCFAFSVCSLYVVNNNTNKKKNTDDECIKELQDYALSLVDILANQRDVLHANYWNWRKSQLFVKK